MEHKQVHMDTRMQMDTMRIALVQKHTHGDKKTHMDTRMQMDTMRIELVRKDADGREEQ